jgi:hypothetical protein
LTIKSRCIVVIGNGTTPNWNQREWGVDSSSACAAVQRVGDSADLSREAAPPAAVPPSRVMKSQRFIRWPRRRVVKMQGDVEAQRLSGLEIPPLNFPAPASAIYRDRLLRPDLGCRRRRIGDRDSFTDPQLESPCRNASRRSIDHNVRDVALSNDDGFRRLSDDVDFRTRWLGAAPAIVLSDRRSLARDLE